MNLNPHSKAWWFFGLLLTAGSAFADHNEVVLAPGGQLGPTVFTTAVLIRCEPNHEKLMELAATCIVRHSRRSSRFRVVQLIPMEGSLTESEVIGRIDSADGLRNALAALRKDGTCRANRPFSCLIQKKTTFVPTGIPGVQARQESFAVSQLVEVPGGFRPVVAWESGPHDSRAYARSWMRELEEIGVCKKREADGAGK